MVEECPNWITDVLNGTDSEVLWEEVACLPGPYPPTI